MSEAVKIITKPKLSLKAAKVFFEIADYIRKYSIPRERMATAASDVMDGWMLGRDPEVKELVRKRIIKATFVGDRGWNSGWTWDLTEYGCDLMRLGSAPGAADGGERA